ncbi:MAG: helix-hairpin-helix domain-containing protein [Bacteroidetes bacterium]|nr:helix-hairpin-helix domain-containing protein [Bacteroidota bacterium]
MKFLFTFLFFLPFIILLSQNDTTFQSNEGLNIILEESTEDDEDSQLFNLIEDFKNNPVDLNSASVNDLLKIPFIDFYTAQTIISYRNDFGYFKSETDLYSIKDLNKVSLDNIISFVTVKNEFADESAILNATSYQNIKMKIRSRVIEDIQNRKGFSEKIYQGNKYKFYNRLKGELKDYKINILTEKDAGEKSFSDFYSVNLNADNFYLFDKIILGDYLIEFGQGLALWGPYAFSKSGEAVSSIGRSGRGIVPYSGTDENQFFRGAAARINSRKFDLSIFFSSNKIDANISFDGSITSTPLDGYHRSENELTKKDKTNLVMTGGIVNYFANESTSINFLYFHTKFSNQFIKEKIYDLKGSDFNFYSLSYSGVYNKLYINGEFSFNGISAASINNVEFRINKSFSLAASFRNYPRNYYNIFSRGFGESSNTINEKGFYFGLKTKINSTSINVYYDQFKFPFATFSNPVSTYGNELLIDLFHSFSSKLKFRIRYTKEEKEISTESNNINLIDIQRKQKIRIEGIFNLSKNFRLKTRAEYSCFTLKESNYKSRGYLLFQDLRYSPSPALSFYARLIFFDTDSYDSRIYQFENDLIGIMNNTALFGKGSKWYFIINYDLLNNIIISAKYSELYQPELRTLSSGLNEINGNLSSRISIQVDLKF